MCAGLGDVADRPANREADCSGWRRQGLDPLSAGLAAWQTFANPTRGGSLQDGHGMVRTLRGRERHRDLAGVRKANAGGELSEPAREAWRALWADVDATVCGAPNAPAYDYNVETRALGQGAIRQLPNRAGARAMLLDSDPPQARAFWANGLPLWKPTPTWPLLRPQGSGQAPSERPPFLAGVPGRFRRSLEPGQR
jgi:hypothetical protein